MYRFSIMFKSSTNLQHHIVDSDWISITAKLNIPMAPHIGLRTRPQYILPALPASHLGSQFRPQFTEPRRELALTMDSNASVNHKTF